MKFLDLEEKAELHWHGVLPTHDFKIVIIFCTYLHGKTMEWAWRNKTCASYEHLEKHIPVWNLSSRMAEDEGIKYFP